MHDLGLVSAILADRSLEDVILFAAAHRFKCVELMCWPKGRAERRYAGVTHIDADTLTSEEAAAIKQLLREQNVYISGLGYYPNPLDPDTEKASVYIAHLKKVIAAAALLGVSRVNTFIGRDPTATLEHNFALFQKVWPDIVRFAEDHNVKIGIENCPMLFTQDEWPGGKNMAVSPAVWERMFTLIPSPSFGLNYDPSHLVWQQMDEVRPIYDFRERIFHVHLKDVRVYREKLNRCGILAIPLDYHSPKLPGLGEVNWRSFFGALTDIRYRGPVCIEVEDKAFESTPEDVHNGILLSRNYLEQFLAG
ncbi:MAG: sugar phosphate isomerase/epimerase family protein [Candidatus Methylacidiphilales bacterium]|nr:sugar phosphate isomerase/epimerase family protein [Candidatus Methylacidiphilales bacterium]